MADLFENLNDRQREAVLETEGYVRVIAGAGSGKTKLLVSRYAYLVQDYGIDSSNILCVTFTNKAAGEMKKMVTRKKRTPVMTQDTYRGRINIGITQLKKLFPDKQIVLLTPLHRSLANFGDKNVQPDESYQNGCGEYIDAYVQAIKEAGNIWGIPVIDFNAVTGMNPMVEEQLIYFYDAGYDRLHPDTKGQERMARTLMYQLLALPVAF